MGGSITLSVVPLLGERRFTAEMIKLFSSVPNKEQREKQSPERSAQDRTLHWYTALSRLLPVRGCCWRFLWAFSEMKVVKECSPASVISAIPHQDSNCFVDKTRLLFTPTSQITFDTQHAGLSGHRVTSLPGALWPVLPWIQNMTPAS